jgi:hypothetical protein
LKEIFGIVPASNGKIKGKRGIGGIGVKISDSCGGMDKLCLSMPASGLQGYKTGGDIAGYVPRWRGIKGVEWPG